MRTSGSGTRSPSKPLRRGLVRKYGVPIGRASAPIAAGAFVHTHNLEDITEELCRQYVAAFRDGRGA
ncbi:MAG: SAF domain-containing protein [Bilophila wadsworthia]